MKDRNAIIASMLTIEGGYVNDPADSGGETNHGVTARVARKGGYDGCMRAMTEDDACDIYRRLYWDANHLDDIAALSTPVAAKVFDIAVNMGNGRAGEFLQRILNVMNNRGAHYADIKVDGDIGGQTVSAFRAYIAKRGQEGAMRLEMLLCCMQGDFYITLAERREKDERFMYGWAKRMREWAATGVIS